jgi:hypothetical protein
VGGRFVASFFARHLGAGRYQHPHGTNIPPVASRGGICAGKKMRVDDANSTFRVHAPLIHVPQDPRRASGTRNSLEFEKNGFGFSPRKNISLLISFVFVDFFSESFYGVFFFSC